MVDGVTDAGVVTADLGDLGISVPINPASPVEIQPSDPSAPTMTVSLPDELDLKSGRVAADGTVVYEGRGDTDVAVQMLDDGSTRLQTITNSADGPQEFSYSFGDGIKPIAVGDGTIELVQDYGQVAMTVGVVDAAWALDANGNPVATEYRIDGDSVVQVVAPDTGTAFPIVADPKISWAWWGFTVYYNKADTITMASGYAGCAALSVLIPDPTVTKVVAATCGVASVFAGDALARGKCIKLVKYGWVGPAVPQQYGGSEFGRYCR